MVSVNRSLIPLAFVLVVLLVGASYFAFTFHKKNLELKDTISTLQNNSLENKAFLETTFDEWSGLLDDPNKLIFSYWIMNYGSVEAKNVQMRCNIQDTDDTVLFSYDENIGNVPAHWTSYGEMIVPKNLIYYANQERNITGVCFVNSCANCEILFRRIPSLVASYEGD